MNLTTLRKRGAAGLCAVAVALGISLPGASAQTVFPPAELGGLTLTNAQPARIHVAQAQDAAQLMVHIQQLEEQVRLLNGQVEGLTFQLTQMQEIVTRAEARLQALEGGGGAVAPAPAVPAATDAVPSTEIPAQGVQPLPGEAEFDPTFDDGSAPADSLGQSGDPLVGTGSTGGIDLATGQPLDLSFNPAAQPSGNADADAQFTAGYEALVQGDYAFAEDQFSQFIELYPDNAKVTDAANFLGDALIQRQAYSEAADVLLSAFQKAPDSPRAPDLLLRLGISLSGAGERETACRTFSEVDKRFTSLTPAFVTRLTEEKTRAECPPA